MGLARRPMFHHIFSKVVMVWNPFLNKLVVNPYLKNEAEVPTKGIKRPNPFLEEGMVANRLNLKKVIVDPLSVGN